MKLFLTRLRVAVRYLFRKQISLHNFQIQFQPGENLSTNVYVKFALPGVPGDYVVGNAMAGRWTKEKEDVSVLKDKINELEGRLSSVVTSEDV